MKYDALKNELNSAVLVRKKGPSKALGVNVSPENAEKFKQLGEFLGKRGVPLTEVLSAVMTLCQKEGFKTEEPEEAVALNIRIRETTLEDFEKLCAEVGIKKSSYFDQMLNFFFEKFEGIPESDAGYPLLETRQSPEN